MLSKDIEIMNTLVFEKNKLYDDLNNEMQLIQEKQKKIIHEELESITSNKDECIQKLNEDLESQRELADNYFIEIQNLQMELEAQQGIVTNYETKLADSQESLDEVHKNIQVLQESYDELQSKHNSLINELAMKTFIEQENKKTIEELLIKHEEELKIMKDSSNDILIEDVNRIHQEAKHELDQVIQRHQQEVRSLQSELTLSQELQSQQQQSYDSQIFELRANVERLVSVSLRHILPYDIFI